MIQGFDRDGVAIQNQLFKIDDGNARVFFEPHSPDAMLVEHLASDRFGESTFHTRRFTKKIDLSRISMIATDLRSFFFEGEN